MKNKFKKSKIIVPALALITATTVASVTGTVAWFTASRAVTVSATTFETKTEGSNLTVTTSPNANAGTKAIAGTTTADAAIEVDGTLTHGSYNAKVITTSDKGGSLYSPNINDDGSIASFNDLGTESNHGTGSTGGTESSQNKWKVKTSTGNIWYGVSWTMTFSQSADPQGYTNALLFDPSSSTATENNKATGISEDNSTIKGLRIALMTGTKCIVVSRNSSDQGAHINGTVVKTNEATSWGNQAKLTFFSPSTKVAKQQDLATTVSTCDYYLGDINGTSGLSVTAVAWFEGQDTTAITTYTDQDHTTARIMSQVEATLGFYSRKYAKTTD